jgi:hypothetical protein
MWTTDPANPTVDLVVYPPWGYNAATNSSCERGSCPAAPCAHAEACPHKLRSDYAYDDPAYNWRALRVLNSSDDFIFVQWDPLYNFGVAPSPAPPRPPGPSPPPIQPAKVMRDVDVVGRDEPSPCPAAPYNNTPAMCEAACQAKAGCVAWTLHHNQERPSAPGWRCCTKTDVASLRRATGMTSGILHPDALDDALVSVTEDAVDAQPAVGHVTFSEFYDIRADRWQMVNLWPTLGDARQHALEAEIAKRFACRGTRDTPSTCE